jgi:hypothetical protein
MSKNLDNIITKIAIYCKCSAIATRLSTHQNCHLQTFRDNSLCFSLHLNFALFQLSNARKGNGNPLMLLRQLQLLPTFNSAMPEKAMETLAIKHLICPVHWLKNGKALFETCGRG